MPTYAVNKRARFDFEVIEKFEAGIHLTGPEVKSIRLGGVKLTGSFVTFFGNRLVVTNMHVSPYRHAVKDTLGSPTRSRELLLHAKEINYLRGKTEEKGLTIIPLSIYTKGRHIKLEIAIVRGKKQFDKRESIKKRELDREMKRARKG